jgi:hypothetical protein
LDKLLLPRLFNLVNEMIGIDTRRLAAAVVLLVSVLLPEFLGASPQPVNTLQGAPKTSKQQDPSNNQKPIEINRVKFDFQSGDLQGWHLVSGQPPAAVQDEADKHYLSTRAVGSLGPGDMTLSAQGIRAVIESPVFRLTGATATFGLGGFADGKAAYLALYDLNGRELRRVSPAGRRGDAGKLKPMTWDVAELAGKSVYLRLIDRAGSRNGGYVELDDFRVAGQPDREATLARRKHHDAIREAALVPARRQLTEIGKLVFAVREPGKNGHWYANFGHWSTRPDHKMYGKGGRLCVLTLNVEKGVRNLLPERPAGCFAQKVSDPFFN